MEGFDPSWGSGPKPPPKGLSRFVAARNFKATVKTDTSGRKGKIVTVIDGLPKNEPFLKEMTKVLKVKCGAGGNYDLGGRDGTVEIQGDHREKVIAYLTSEEISVKGALPGPTKNK